MFSRVLVANRGEIAVRVARTCHELGVEVVAVHSDVDARSRHVAAADETIHLSGVAPADTYLKIDALVDAARSSRAEAVHPGYGFLAENADFAEAVEGAGIAWIGPSPEVTRAMGDKVRARNLAHAAGIPVVPGTMEPVETADEVVDFARAHSYPIALKAAGGGGGRGLKVVRAEDEIADALAFARRESKAYFGTSDVYIESYLEAPKHLEVQVLAPAPGDALWLGVRDCSLQRRHQKLIEETPPPRWSERSEEMGEATVTLAKACGYVNAGTVEMLVDEGGDFYFLEMNARLQVEHTVTEETFGVDLVACQLKIAAGDPLDFGQVDLHAQGHAIECRINAEDPAAGFAPAPGALARYEEPRGSEVRVDSGYGAGDTIPAAYDSLLAKLIVTGRSRDEAITNMLTALDSFVLEGVPTTIPAHRLLLASDAFRDGTHTVATIADDALLAPLAESAADKDGAGTLIVEGRAVNLWHPAMAASASASVPSRPLTGDVIAPMQGTIVRVLVAEGDRVEAGDPILLLEAMKMETTLGAPRAGVVAELLASDGDTTEAGRVLAIVVTE